MPVRASRLAWSLWAVAIGLSIVGGALVLLTFGAPVPDNWGFRGYSDLVAPLVATVGLLIARRQPGNAIGWILLVAGVSAGFGGFAQEYVTYGATTHPGSLPAVVALAWISSWSFSIFAGPMIMLVPQLFPTGAPLSPRWRPLLWAGATFIPFAFVVFGLRPGPLENAAAVDNPFGATGVFEDIRRVVYYGGSAFLLATTVASGASLVVRFRGARGMERQQLKWVAFSGSLVVAAFAVLIASNTSKPAQILMIAAFTTVPLAIGIAILRYRLYEIDTIINRTLVYGALTAILAGVFAASTEVLKRLFVEVTGGNSDAAVVVALFFIATLFAPVRLRLQRFVDRRFQPGRSSRAAHAPSPVAHLLRDLKQLHDDGVLDDAEYATKKRELLARI